MSAHLIEFIKVNGKKVYLDDFCKDDEEFQAKVDKLYRKYGPDIYISANHNSRELGRWALSKCGEWVVKKEFKARTGDYPLDLPRSYEHVPNHRLGITDRGYDDDFYYEDEIQDEVLNEDL